MVFRFTKTNFEMTNIRIAIAIEIENSTSIRNLIQIIVQNFRPIKVEIERKRTKKKKNKKKREDMYLADT